MRLPRTPWIALVLIVGCAPGGSGPAGDRPPSNDAGQSTLPAAVRTPAEVAAGSRLTFGEDASASMEGLVTFKGGGTVTATAADGTRFDLFVPAHSVLLDTTIRLTPLVDVAGIGTGPVHAVRLEPEGLSFFEAAELTITPASPIPIAQQALFQAEGSGAEVTAALVDVDSEAAVLLLEHFSLAGIAVAQARASWLIGQAASALTRLSHEVGLYLQAERRRQMGGSSADPNVQDVLERMFGDAEREALSLLREAAMLSCEGATAYTQGLRSIERQRELTGNSSDETLSAMLTEVARARDASFSVCEREAIAKCQAARPPTPTILVNFWLGWDRQRALQGLEEPLAATGDFAARAARICVATRWALERVVRVVEGGIEWVITYEGLLEVATDGRRDPETGEVSVDGPITGHGTGTIAGLGGECIQDDRTVPIDVRTSGAFRFVFDGHRSGDSLYVALIAIDPDVDVSGSFAPCLDMSDLFEEMLEEMLEDPIYLGTSVVVEEVGTTSESAEGVSIQTTLSEPPATAPPP